MGPGGQGSKEDFIVPPNGVFPKYSEFFYVSFLFDETVVFVLLETKWNCDFYFTTCKPA